MSASWSSKEKLSRCKTTLLRRREKENNKNEVKCQKLIRFDLKKKFVNWQWDKERSQKKSCRLKVVKFKDTKMTSPAATLTDLEATAFNETSNIHYSRPATIFAAVAASIFTFVGITGKKNF